MRERIGRVIAATCVLGACMLLLPTAAQAQESINSKFLEQMMTDLTPVAISFMAKVGRFMTPLLASLATIFVIWTALKNFLSDRAFSETIAEVLMTLLIVTALTNTSNYKWLFWDTMYGGLYSELIVPTGESSEAGFALALANMQVKQAEAAAKANLSAAEKAVLAVGGAVNTMQGRDTGFIWLLCQILTQLTYPMLQSAVILAIISITFYGGIGQIFLSMWLFDFTKDYTKKWFGCFMGAIFSLVAISFFYPFLNNWNDTVTTAVEIETASKGVAEQLMTPGLLKQLAWSFCGIMAALKAPSMGKELFR